MAGQADLSTCIQVTLFFWGAVSLEKTTNKQTKKDKPFPWQLLYTKVDHMTQF